jgi:hypothetical protein
MTGQRAGHTRMYVGREALTEIDERLELFAEQVPSDLEEFIRSRGQR